MVHGAITDMATIRINMNQEDKPLKHNITGMVYKFPIRHPVMSAWLLEFANGLMLARTTSQFPESCLWQLM